MDWIDVVREYGAFTDYVEGGNLFMLYVPDTQDYGYLDSWTGYGRARIEVMLAATGCLDSRL